MGCAQSTEAEPQRQDRKPAAGAPKAPAKRAPQPQLSQSLTRQMTVGEAMDAKMERSANVQQRLEDAKAELEANRNRWIWDLYEEESVLLGRGAYARVFRGRLKATKTPVAIKVISKDNKFFEQQQRAMVTKVACMRALQGHRNMVKLYDVFQEPEGDHVVLEYMPAKPLFDAIVEKGHFSEADAAVVMKQLLQFLRFMHDLDVVHRDIKPENLLLLKPHRQTYEASCSDEQRLSPEDERTAEEEHKLPWLTREEEGLVDESLWSDVPDGLRLKVIDYGTSNFCERGQHLHSKIGTARYVAPEVLSRDYDKSSDIWSAGVVLYILLCGHAPFKGSTDTGTLAKVKTGVYSMEGSGWEHVSDSARDLLRHMLVVDPGQRWTAEELLDHMWFQDAPAMSAPRLGANQGYLQRLNTFAGASRMKRLMLKLLANEQAALTTKEVARLKDLFNELDTDHDGLIDGPALHKALAAVGCDLNEHDVREFLAVSKVDSRHAAGRVDINEFIAALFDSERVVALAPEMVEAEFKRLDVDGDGLITAADLVAVSKATEDDGGAGLLVGGGTTLTLEEARDILAELSSVPPPPMASSPGSRQATGIARTSATDAAGGSSSAQNKEPVLGIGFREFRELMLNGNASFPLVAAERTSTMRRTPSTLALSRPSNILDTTASASALATATSEAPTTVGAAAGGPVASTTAVGKARGPGDATSQLTSLSTNDLSSAAVIVAMPDSAAAAGSKGAAPAPLANGNGGTLHAA